MRLVFLPSLAHGLCFGLKEQGEEPSSRDFSTNWTLILCSITPSLSEKQSHRNTDVSTKLCDQHPLSKPMNLCEGIHRSLRKISLLP